MGLTESNQSRSSFWGPSKSKSTQFAEGVYEGKPRQAVTLPSRPLTRSVNNNVTSTDDSALSIVNSRPPDFFRHKERSLYVSARELYTYPPSVQNSKQSEQQNSLSNTPLKLPPRSKNSESPLREKGLVYTPPSNDPQNFSHLRKTSLSAASLINEASDDYEYVPKRVRSRSHNYRKRDSSSSSRKTGTNGVTLEEKETQTFPDPSIFSVNYDNRNERHGVHTQRRSVSFKENKNGAITRRSRKNGKKTGEKVSCSVPTTPSEIESDPYICLHFGSTVPQETYNKEYRDDPVTACRPIFSEACLYIPKKDENLNTTSESISPKRKKSQIIIQLDNKNANQVDILDPAKVNNGAYEVCSNVWFESRFNVGEKNCFKQNTVVNMNEISQNEYSKCINDVLSIGNTCKNSEIGCRRNELNQEQVSQYGPDSKFEENPVFDIKLGDASTKIQSHKFNQCLTSSDSLINSGEMYCSASNSQVNYNAGQHDFKNLMLETSAEISDEKEDCEKTYETIAKPSLSPSYSFEKPTEMLSMTAKHEVKNLSLDEAVSKRDLVMWNENDSENIGLLKWQDAYSKNEKDLNDCRIVEQGQNLSFASKYHSDNHCQIIDSFKSSTLPSQSVYVTNITSNDVWCDGTLVNNPWCDGSQGRYLNKNETRSSCSLIGGTFPVLRLPKPASQPRLIDVLRNQKENYTRQSNDSEVTERESSQTSHDTAQSRSQMCPYRYNILSNTNDTDINASDSSTMIAVAATCSYNTPGTENTSEREVNVPVAPKNDFSLPQVVKENEDRKYQMLSNVNRLSIGPCNPPYSESVKSLQCDGHCLNYNNKTIPARKQSNYREKLKRFFSLRLKHVQKMDSSIDCNLMCHEQCQGLVALDCKMDSPDIDLKFHDAEQHLEDDSPSDDFFPLEDNENDTLPKEPIENLQPLGCEDVEVEENVEIGEEEKHEEEMLEKEIILEQEISTLKKQEVSTLRRTVRRIQSQAVDSAKIEEWVQKCPANNVGLQITKEEDGGYRGCLRIHLNLSRPINIVTGTRPPSIYDIMQEERTLEKTLTSFYMPRDTVKAIHITSKTTTREVIVALLRKFKVVDNPQKFALYERTYDTGQSMKAKLRRLSDNECPLVLAIAWNAQEITSKRLVLQENDTADIQWEAFSLPELDNFLRILDREEGEYKNQIRDKYSSLRYRIQLQLSRMTPMNT